MFTSIDGAAILSVACLENERWIDFRVDKHRSIKHFGVHDDDGVALIGSGGYQILNRNLPSKSHEGIL